MLTPDRPSMPQAGNAKCLGGITGVFTTCQFAGFLVLLLGTAQKSLEENKRDFLRMDLCWIFAHKADINLETTNSPTVIQMNS